MCIYWRQPHFYFVSFYKTILVFYFIFFPSLSCCFILIIFIILYFQFILNFYFLFFRAQGQLICGPRILTFFLYLSDVEEGGETAFPSLGIKVKPKKGKAVLWPSVMDHDLLQYEPLSLHEVSGVEE